VRRSRAVAALLAAVAVAGLPFPACASEAPSLQADTLRYGRFGPVVLYRGREHESRVVLLVSGEEGWNQQVVTLARELATMEALVVGVDLRRYLVATSAAESCLYPAADFEALSQWVQQRLGFPAYVTPALVGYSSGASLVHATLAQAPPGTFGGGLGIGFRPAESIHRQFCRGDQSPSAPWIAVDDPAALEDALARLASPPDGMSAAPTPTLADLPLVELRPAHPSAELAVVVSGDGGWASIDRQIGETFAAGGLPVVGLNSLQYFWKAKTPDQAGADLTRMLRHYLQVWNASRVVLVGYSRGADVLPFMVARLPADLRGRVDAVALLGLSPEAGFEFHFADLLGRKAKGLPTVPEIRRLRGLRILCVYGTDETDSACRELPPGLASVEEVPGGHHFAGAYRDVARRILAMARAPQKISKAMTAQTSVMIVSADTKDTSARRSSRRRRSRRGVRRLA
jgi:type IV secretory pathway VirJ component